MTTRYVDNRLTTGLNDGTSEANAYRSLEDLRNGISGGGVDVVQFVAGSGPYREVFSTRSTRMKTDLSFAASDRSLNSVGTDLTTFTFAPGDIVQVYGSPLNSKQLTIATVAASKITFIATNTVVDESAGASVCVTAMTGGSNIAAMDLASNGTALAPRRWMMNGCEIDCGRSIDTNYTWTASGVANEWYLRRADLSNPSLLQPFCATINGSYVSDSSDLGMDMGTVGSLTATAVMGWGDNDSLGYNTCYVYSITNPSEKMIRIGQVYAGVNTTWQYHSIEDGYFILANRDSGSNAGRGVCIDNRSTSKWWIKRCICKFAALHAIETGNTGETFLECSLGYFCGHRFLSLSANGTLSAVNCLDYGSHIFALIGPTMTYQAQMVIRNCIAMHGEAGSIDKKSSAAQLHESHNVWYPRFGASGAALGYVSAANWSTTHATDYPPSAATSISTVEANVAAGALDPQLVNPSDTEFTLGNFKPTNSSAVIANGAPGTDLVDITGVALHGRSQNPDRGPWLIGGVRPRAVRN